MAGPPLLNRRQRRAAERLEKKNGAAWTPPPPPPSAPAAPPRTPPPPAPVREDYGSLFFNTPELSDGVELDILDFTPKLAAVQPGYPGHSNSTDYDVIKLERNPVPWSSPGLEEYLRSERKAWRSTYRKTGTMCEACGHLRSIPRDIKRCSRCQQVSYCNTQCQETHWPKHKLFCHFDELNALPKDAIGCLLRSLRESQNVGWWLLLYACTVLKVADNPSDGLRWYIEFVLTLVPDPVRHAGGSHQHKSMLQIVTAYKLRSWMSEDEIARDVARLGKDGPLVHIVMSMDFKGAGVPQYRRMRAPPELSVASCSWPQPAVLLGMINLLIQEDVDNLFQLRVPGPVWLHSLPRIPYRLSRIADSLDCPDDAECECLEGSDGD